MSRKLTKKQLAFVAAYLETGKAGQSYRDAYACAAMSDKAISVEANKLLKDPRIALLIQEGRAEARERSQVTVESLTTEMEENRQLAYTAGNPTAAVAATMAKAKLHGLADGEGAQPEKAVDIGGRPVDTGASKWAAVKAEVEAEWRRKRKEEKPDAGNGADRNASSDTRH